MLQPLNRLSLKYRLLILGLAIVLPAVVIIVQGNMEERSMRLEEARRGMRIVLESLREEQETITSSTELMLQALANMPALKSKDAAVCSQVFQELIRKNPRYESLFAATLNGIPFASSLTSTPGVSIASRKYFQDCLKTGQFSAGEYAVGFVMKRPLIHFAYPVRDDRKKMVAVVVASLNLGQYKGVLSKYKLPEGFVQGIADRRGIRLFRYPDGEQLVGAPVTPGVFRQMQEGEDGEFAHEYPDGATRLHMFKKLTLPGQETPYLYIYTAQDEKRLSAAANRELIHDLSVLGIFLLLTWILSYLMVKKSFLAPVEKLLDATRQISTAGYPRLKTGISYEDAELGTLARAFDDMSERVEQEIRERRQTEEALRAQAIQNQLALEAARMGTWQRDLATDQIRWSSVQEAIMGFAPGTFPGTQAAFRRRIHPDDLKQMHQAGRQARETHQSFRVDYRIVWPDRSVHWLSSLGRYLYDSQDQPVRAIGVTYDVTEARRSQEETEVLAEIGRIIGSSLEIDEVYERFSAEVLKLLPFDLLSVTLIDAQSGHIKLAYMNGLATGRKTGDLIPLAGSLPEELLRIKRGFIVNETDPETLRRRFPAVVSSYQLGVQSILAVPLMVKDEVVGGLLFRSRNPLAYDEKDLPLAQRIADQIAGAVANAELYAALKQEEENKAVMAEIGRIISASLNIDDEFERFGSKVRKLIPFDRLGISLQDRDKGMVRIAYVTGTSVAGREKGAVFPLSGSLNELLMHTRTGIVIHPESVGELQNSHPWMINSYNAGDRSMIAAPLILRGDVIGILNIRSKQEHAYTPEHLRLAERIADQIGGAIANAELFTALKRMERSLSESEAKYRNLFDQGPDGIMLMSTDGEEFIVNDSFAQMHGYRPEEMKGLKLPNLDTPESACLAPERFSRLLSGESLIFEVEHIHRDGHVFPLRVSARVIHIGGRSYYLGFHRDLSERQRQEVERRELEERLNRAEKMEALGLLAGGVAHDLNNTLGILVGYAELLQDTLDESDPRRQDAENIITGGERAAAIVQDLLTLARRGVQTKSIVNLNRVVTEYLKSAELFKLKSFHPGVRLKAELEEDLLHITGSPLHLSKTLMNLVSNAAEAMKTGGEITIRTANCYLDRPVAGYDLLKEGDYVILTVADEGEGISDADLKHIFEPFYTKKVMGMSGTGLGLSVVWGAVKDHDGYIDVRSRPGQGTAFQLYFPVTHGQEAEEEAALSAESLLGQGERILVVDDIATQRDLASRILTKLNYHVDAAASGEAAVEYLKEKAVDLVILDMIMDPGIDGFETYRQITAVRPAQKAIIVSGFAETDRVAMAQALGAGTFVKKPYVRERLGRAVRRELDRELTKAGP